eukprot:27392_5
MSFRIFGFGYAARTLWQTSMASTYRFAFMLKLSLKPIAGFASFSKRQADSYSAASRDCSFSMMNPNWAHAFDEERLFVVIFLSSSWAKSYLPPSMISARANHDFSNSSASLESYGIFATRFRWLRAFGVCFCIH